MSAEGRRRVADARQATRDLLDHLAAHGYEVGAATIYARMTLLSEIDNWTADTRHNGGTTMDGGVGTDFRGIQWLTIDPHFTFVVTLLSDLYHIRHQETPDERMLCGRTVPLEAGADYPAKALKVNELCKSCLASYQRREREAMKDL